MQIGNALRVAILLALYSFAGADVTAGAGSGTFCYWTSSGAQGRSHYSFLRLSANNARPRSLQLYHSVWTRDRGLVDCAVTDEPAVAERYLSLCRGEQSEKFTDVPETRFDVSLLFAPDNPCADPFPAGVQASKRMKRQINDPDLAERQARDGSKVKLRRQKRAWIIPGTVWCGSGNKATNYNDLGLFAQTDMCCREHDHCADTITSFKFGYGIFNRHFFTVLHCDCEDRFRQCLLTANDTVSNMVGYGYFNLIKTPCFTFTEKMQCTRTNWFGMCTLSEMSPYAVLQEPMEYNATQPVPEDEGFGNATVPSATLGTGNITSDSTSPTPMLTPTLTPTPTPMPMPTPVPNVPSPAAGTGQPPVRGPKPRPRCRPRGPARGPASRPGRRRGLRRKVCEEQPNSPLPPKGRDSDTNLTAVSAAGGGDPIAPPHQRGDPSSENALPTARPRTPQPVPHNHPAPLEDIRETETLQPCDCYKHLDECRLKIPPLGERFGLKNPERKTLYHCNCTNRLAQQLQALEEPDGVQSLLVDFVSQSCFLLAPPEECPGTAQGCPPAVLSEASHLRLALSRQENRGGEKYAETPILKVKRHNTRKSKRKQIPVKLYKKCLRIMDSKTLQRAEG
ncbi:group 3 secretory phospholipase A2 [Anguilla rostrata]|uniref:group 3 secretory phospholipase A2 n=1 Tax=Anguilla rostrata TaxID=7938 RepID=UPI0030D213DA